MDKRPNKTPIDARRPLFVPETPEVPWEITGISPVCKINTKPSWLSSGRQEGLGWRKRAFRGTRRHRVPIAGSIVPHRSNIASWVTIDSGRSSNDRSRSVRPFEARVESQRDIPDTLPERRTRGQNARRFHYSGTHRTGSNGPATTARNRFTPSRTRQGRNTDSQQPNLTTEPANVG